MNEAKEEKSVMGLDDEVDEEDTLIVLVSKEKQKYKVSRKASMMSTLIQNSLEGDKDAAEVTLFHIEGTIIEKIIEYMTYHLKKEPRIIEKPLQSNNLKDLVDIWDANFIDVPQEVMFKLLLAANYMHISPLLNLVCAKVASLMKGKNPEQIRKTFNIRNDPTPQEEAEIREQYKDLLG